MDENLKDLDENLAWLTQKTEDPKGILHHFLYQLPLFSFIPPFLAKNVVPPPPHPSPPSQKKVTQFLEGQTLPLLPMLQQPLI